jgi:hypothetical protein
MYGGEMDKPSPKRNLKTEVLSVRMDPKTRFVVEFLARIRGQSISTVVERAIQEAADNARIEGDFDGPRTWKDYWHVSEGIRSLMVLSDKRLYSSFDEEYKLAFTKTHWQFFFNSPKCDDYKEWSVEILWPKIDEFLDIWTRTKTNDYFAAGRAMREALLAAGVKPPEWPPKDKGDSRPSKTERQAATIQDLDDEIPF